MDADNISLHSAAESCNLEAAELLLKEKLDIYAKDEKGMTPLHILMQKRIGMFSSLNKNQREQPLTNDIEKNKKFIETLLEYTSINLSYTDDMKLLNFQAACTLENCAIIESFLEKIEDVNQPISENSSIWPGYTGLHFAAHCRSINTLKILIANNGNLLAQDKSGITAFDNCMKAFNVEELHSILTCVVAWRDILFSDGKTKLMDYVSVLHDEDSHKNFVQSMGKEVGASLSKNSPLWPGQTILHIAVTLLHERKRDMIIDILDQGADVTIQDVNGSTPVHLAFCQDRLELVNKLLQYHKKVLSPLNKDNLSHLHIASIVNNQSILKKFLTIEANINIAYNGKSLPNVKTGWTPLHTVCFTGHSIVAKMLLEAGADLLQTDAKGFTAIHRLFGINRKKLLALKVLIDSRQLKECVVDSIGLTHLHVMASYNKTDVVKRLLDQGANIEATIINVEGKKLKQFAGCTPLHLATENHHLETVKLLLKRGADILAKKSDGTTPLSEALCGEYDEPLLEPFVSLLWTNKKLQKRVKNETGLTMLHLVCYAVDLEKIKNLLKKRINVNAKVRDDSPIWPRFTPLHVLTHLRAALTQRNNIKEKLEEAIILLLDKKADVTLINAEGNTPVQLILDLRFKDQRCSQASLLMKYHRNFKVNPTNKQGVSHFHIACLVCDLTAVEGFLQHGADVNQPVNETDKFTGKSPLHLALNSAAKNTSGTKLQLQVVDALLEHGANVDAVDARGWSPIHNVAECSRPRQKLLERIVRTDADMNKETNNGETPFEILIHRGVSVNEMEMFRKHGSRVNSYNRINNKGYMAIILDIDTISKEKRGRILDWMMSQSDIAEVDERGRNAIYNMFGFRKYLDEDDYVDLIEKLIKLGCNIYQQDQDGKTPLHVAIELDDDYAVHALLRCGADINLVDSAGLSPFSYYAEHKSSRISGYICEVLIRHLETLQLVGLEVSQLNISNMSNPIFLSERDPLDEIALRNQLEQIKEIKIGQRGLTLYDFAFEKDVVKIISLFAPAERDIVGTVLESIDYKKFSSLSYVLKLQYRKVLERPLLMIPAKKSFISLLEFPLPDLCTVIIFKFLSNVELKNLVSAANLEPTIGNDDLEMFVD